MQYTSLRLRVIGLIILAVIPAFSLATYSTVHQRQEAVRKGQAEVDRLSNLVAMDLGTLLEKSGAVLGTLAADPHVRRGDLAEITPHLAGALEGHSELSSIVVAGPGGRVVASATPLAGPVELGDSEYWSRLRTAKDLVVGDYALGRISGRPVLTLAYPILDKSGRLQGGVVAGMSLDRLGNLGAEARLPEGAVLTILDRSGVILARHPGSEAWVGKSLPEADLVNEIMRQGDGAAEMPGLDGVRRLYGFHAAHTPAAGVYVVVGLPGSVINASANETAAWTFLALSSGVLFGGLVAWFAAGAFVLRPIGQLVLAAKSLAGGDLSARCRSRHARGELAQLANAFDEMAETIAQRTTKLVAAEESYRILVDATPDLIYSLDPEGRLTAVNRAFCEALGASPEELVGRSASQVGFPPAIVEEWRALTKRALAGEEVGAPTTTPMPDGSLHTYEVVLSPVRDRGGAVRGVRAVNRDVTDRERALLALKESEERFRQLVESSPNGITIHNESHVVYANPAAARLIGAGHPQELVGRKLMEFVHPDFRDVVLSRARAVLENREVAPLMEEKYLRLDGTEIDVEVVAMPFSHGGKPAVSAIIRDITEKKEAERALRQREEELRQSQRLEAIGRLAGGVAHDFNNLLTAIVGYADLLLASNELGTQGEDVIEIRRAADRAAELTRQLLAFSRRQPLQPRVIDLNVVAASLTGLLERLVGEDVDLVFRQESSLWPVEADPGQIEQVLMNLVINSRDAMPEGGKITIDTANVLLDEEYTSHHLSAQIGAHVMLAVSDTGVGIPPDIVPHVFEPFFSTKAAGKGTGLGLATVYGIVKQSGGNIWVYSEPGQGTTIKIYLPCSDKSTDWAPQERKDQGGVRVEGGQELVLIVEDELAVRALAGRVLGRHGYRVLTAGSSEEGLLTAAGHDQPIDLLLTDVVLPGASGRQLAEDLAHRQGPPFAVLYMSGYTRNAIVHNGRLDEGIEFLEKPFTPEGLLRRVREVLARSRGESQQ